MNFLKLEAMPARHLLLIIVQALYLFKKGCKLLTCRNWGACFLFLMERRKGAILGNINYNPNRQITWKYSTAQLFRVFSQLVLFSCDIVLSLITFVVTSLPTETGLSLASILLQ